ncbi:MAG TPA: methyltransferase domain-containing protein [Usitatibacter sp.]|nr:methyltransferase domain-containing protein [Usitatibacter sp.]
MLGERIDYAILRKFANDRHKLTEEELDQGCSSLLDDQAVSKLPKIIERFDGHFPLTPGLRYLDMGSGSGELTLALARMGLDVTGVDFLPRFVETARRNAVALGLESKVKFICEDLRRWTPERPYDVLISFDAMEHIGEPGPFLARMKDFVVPGGIAIMTFGPLFHSPFGDHMSEFFDVQIPWRGAMFSEQAMLRVRREFYRPTDPATRLPDIAGGLNCMTFGEFKRYVREAGWKVKYLRVNPFLQSRILRAVSDATMRIPGVRNLFGHSVYAVLEKPA